MYNALSLFIALYFPHANCHTKGKTLIANQDSRRLYDDLIGDYNRLVRPVGNNSEKLTVYMGIKLTQILDVDEKNQIMTTNVWVRQVILHFDLIYFIIISEIKKL